VRCHSSWITASSGVWLTRHGFDHRGVARRVDGTLARDEPRRDAENHCGCGGPPSRPPQRPRRSAAPRGWTECGNPSAQRQQVDEVLARAGISERFNQRAPFDRLPIQKGFEKEEGPIWQRLTPSFLVSHTA
jgi:hypothetical protein